MHVLYNTWPAVKFSRIKVFGEIEKNSDLYFNIHNTYICTIISTPEKYKIREKIHLTDRSTFFVFLYSV